MPEPSPVSASFPPSLALVALTILVGAVRGGIVAVAAAGTVAGVARVARSHHSKVCGSVGGKL